MSPLPISSSSSPLLAFEPRWSAPRCALVGAQCIICIFVPWLIPSWPVYACILLSLVAVALLAAGYLRAGWWGARRVVRVTWQQSGSWLLQRANDNQDFMATWALSEDSYIVSWLMVLRWHGDAGSAALMVLPGEMRMTAWRQWQARLRLQGAKASHSSRPDV